MVDYFNNIPEDCPWLFYRKARSGYYPLVSIQRAWTDVRKRAGFPDLRLHDLRHVSVTDLADGNVPERIIMSIAGWRENMLHVYYKRQGKKSAEAVNKWFQTEQKLFKKAS